MNLFAHRNRRSLKRHRQLAKLAAMRAAKERKRRANPVEREPRFVRAYPLELGLRDTRTGEVAWVDFKSIRDSVKRLSVVMNNYV